MSETTDDPEDLEEIASKEDVVLQPNEAADPQALIDARIPDDIRERFEVYSYRGAAVLLSEAHPERFAELCDALRAFTITTDMIRIAGGNESDIPKLLSRTLRPLGWNETLIQGDLVIRLRYRELIGEWRPKSPRYRTSERKLRRDLYLDGHKVDYVKDRVAFDMEWNSKDQTFDRDLYAFSAFAQCGVVDVGVLLTRGKDLQSLFGRLGQALTRDGKPEFKKNGSPRRVSEKYGASTTWMGKLLSRLNAGRNGACPVLALGITEKCISDWPPTDPTKFTLPNENGTE